MKRETSHREKNLQNDDVFSHMIHLMMLVLSLVFMRVSQNTFLHDQKISIPQPKNLMIIRIPFLYTGLKNNQTDIQISIVSPLYNKVKYVKRGLESVLNQTYKNIEIIFVDDCSTDGSSEIVESYISKDPRLHLIKHNYNMGSAMARANGVLKSTGQYIFPFDPDDEIYLDAVETLLKLLKENNYPDILEFGCDALAVETGAIQRNWLSCVHSFHTREVSNNSKWFWYLLKINKTFLKKYKSAK
ncbi:hypothetical protein TRFO_42348 [Tritrichomonas foetus]|uniref:Glycosyltransferase 2-like domain-containing protein n=1 Tax=Tritrichomonas foetus TaxID=1144522 RepID=A0A1J4KWY3_9EUKA|nr:hypothetical protein TRFO_42348 [Tritrichomonas foetus]|eukprot:OHT15743.1 hypothetical protein TRFO_42348 [Tritrichomonas foetus]